jgi:hypothetical protein
LEQTPLKVADIVTKNKGLTPEEKDFIFNYIREGDKPK